MTRGALLIGAGVAALGLYFWASGEWRTQWERYRDWRDGFTLPDPPPQAPPVPGEAPRADIPLPTPASFSGPFAWMHGRPEDPDGIRWA